jgi:hypothetical protein
VSSARKVAPATTRAVARAERTPHAADLRCGEDTVPDLGAPRAAVKAALANPLKTRGSDQPAASHSRAAR